MRRKILSLLVLILVSGFIFSQQHSLGINQVKKNAEAKVHALQSIIKFNDKKAQKLVVIEYKFEQQIEKEKGKSSKNLAYSLEKIKSKKLKAIRRILSREEFLKYQAIEKQHIKKYRLRS